jgi:outer membrane protein assembly factor BamB
MLAEVWRLRLGWRRAASVAIGAFLLLAVAASPGWTRSGSDWTKYVHDLGSSGFTSENLITPANAASLRLASGWPVQGGGTISTQPVVSNNFVYWGSWDGYEHATPLPGTAGSGWSTDLGQNYSSACGPNYLGAVSTGAVASVTLAGDTSQRSVLFVGGGGTDTAGGGSAQLYALDALTGAVLWHTPLGSAPDNFMWSSPAVYTYTNSSGATVTSVYVGVSSYCDTPLVQGKLVQLDATTGQVQNTFDVVPSGCIGGGVWGSPTIDQSDGSLYVATGNGGDCSSPEPYAVALLKLRASDLSLLDSWQIPAAEQTSDGDFGAAPTLFSGTVSSGGASRSLVGIPNKNGTYYVFDRRPAQHRAGCTSAIGRAWQLSNVRQRQHLPERLGRHHAVRRRGKHHHQRDLLPGQRACLEPQQPEHADLATRTGGRTRAGSGHGSTRSGCSR